jgi:hypothetical protein
MYDLLFLESYFHQQQVQIPGLSVSLVLRIVLGLGLYLDPHVNQK